MKLFSCFLLMFAANAAAAQPANYFLADAVGNAVPARFTTCADSIASYFKHELKNEEEQVRAAYRWVTANIRYDKDSMLYINWNLDAQAKLAATLRRRKGVCDNFATVFAAIVHKMGIPAYVITGITREQPGTAHSWCAVQLQKNWRLCDPTWDMNYSSECRYFLVAPEAFAGSHWPFDPLWQLAARPRSIDEFEQRTHAEKLAMNFTALQDSVAAFMAMNSLQQFEATARRMAVMPPSRELMRTWYAYNNMNIAIIYGEQDMNLYNDAINDINKANKLLNNFIHYRNNLFTPAKPDSEIAQMLLEVPGLLAQAETKMKNIGRVKENFQYDTNGLQQRIGNTAKKLSQCQGFLNTYLHTDLAKRQDLFYR